MWRTGPWWPRPTTSGIAVPTWLLDRIAPIPEQYFRISPDAYISVLGTFLGPVRAIPEVLGYWRQHDNNATHATPAGRCERQLLFLHGINLGLRERLSITRQVNPDDVWWHQVTRHESGLPVSPATLSRLALRNPSKSLGGRLTDVVRVWHRSWRIIARDPFARFRLPRWL